jgi:hypothetical protein
MALPGLPNGTITIKRKNSQHTIVTVLTDVDAYLGGNKLGATVLWPPNPQDGEQVQEMALYNLYIGSQDENPGNWILKEGDTGEFTYDGSDAAVDWYLAIVGEPQELRGVGLDHWKCPVVRFSSK